jgi:hypothetical protein
MATRRKKSTEENPPSEDADRDPYEVTEDTPLSEGDAVQIEWGGSWWAGSVVALKEDGKVRITYSGYDNSWDENVPRTRLRLPGENKPTRGGGGGKPANTNPGPTDTDPLRAVLSNRPVTEATRLKEGDAVRVEWGGNWWAGSVLSVQKNGTVRIHYEGWDSSWDETVPRSRLCLPPSGPPTLAITFDNGQTIRGTLAGSAGEFLVLQREDGGSRTLVNKQRILYMDAGD